MQSWPSDRSEINDNKKVLLCEPKRHTSHHVASAHCAALSNGGGAVPYPVLAGRVPHPSSRWGGCNTSNPGQGRGYPIQSWPGEYPIQPLVFGVPHPVLAGGVPHPALVFGVPHPVLAGGYPKVPPHLDLGWGTPISWMGCPLINWMGYPPPCLDLGWDTPISWMGYPSLVS